MPIRMARSPHYRGFRAPEVNGPEILPLKIGQSTGTAIALQTPVEALEAMRSSGLQGSDRSLGLIELRNSGLLIAHGRNASGDPRAWVKLVGDKPVEARLETLPENKIRRSALAISSSVQLVIATALVSLPLFFPEQLSTRMIYQVTPVAAPITEVPIQPDKPEQPKKSDPLPPKPVEPVRVAKLFAP